MPKKNIDFIQEINNSQKFLQKLKGIKRESKEIKQRNRLAEHRNIWIREHNYLNKMQRQINMQLRQILQTNDKLLVYEMQIRQVFKRDQYKKFTQYYRYIHDQLDKYYQNVFHHIQPLYVLVQKYKSVQKQLELSKVEDIRNILADCGQLLNKQNMQLNREQSQQTNIMDFIEDEDLFFNLRKLMQHEVRGFDFQENKLYKIKSAQDNLMQYIQSLGNKLTSHQSKQINQEFRYANQLLFQTLQLQLEKIALDYEEALNLDNELINNSSNFHKINHFYQIYIGRGKSVSQYYDRLGLQFPKIGRKLLQKITKYIEAQMYKERKNKAVHRNYLREKEELLVKAQKQVNIKIQNKIKAAQEEAQRLLRKEEKDKLESELQLLRVAYHQRLEEKEKKKREDQQIQKKTQEKKAQIRRIYLQDLNQRAEEIRDIKKDRVQEMEERKKKKEEEMIREKKKNIATNKPNVMRRHSIDRQKIQDKLWQKQKRQMQPHLKQERINQAVENYAFRPHVQYSQTRLTGPTQSLLKKKQDGLDKADKVELTKMTGYNIDQLMGDMRFRLNTALQQAGLSTAKYAREVLTTMSKKPN